MSSYPIDNDIVYSYENIDFTQVNDGVVRLPNGKEYEVLIVSENQEVNIHNLDLSVKEEVIGIVKDAFKGSDVTFSSLDGYTIGSGEITSPRQEVYKIKQANEKEFDLRIIAIFQQIKHTSTSFPIPPKITLHEIKRVRFAEEVEIINPEQSGEIIIDDYKEGDKTVGREEVRRQKTVDLYIHGSRDHIQYLEKQLDTSQDVSEIEKLTSKLEIAKRAHGRASEFQEKRLAWAGTRSFAHYKERTQNEESYPPVTTNLRKVEITDPQTGSVVGEFTRSGALTDWRNGATNIQAIDMLINEFKELTTGKEITSFLKRKENQEVINRIFLKEGALKKEKIDFNLTEENALKFKEEKLQQLHKIKMDREYALQNMFLQDLVTHLEGKDLSTLDSSLDFIRVGLINRKGSEQIVDKVFVRNEYNQIRDMEYIYSQLNEKTLIFDQSGPYIDEEGKIHLPFGDENHPEEKRLQSTYFNISIAAGRGNKGVQKKVNEHSFKELREILKQKYQNDSELLNSKLNDLLAIQDKLEKNPRRNKVEVARDLSVFLLESNIHLSINCYGGKDRTGLLSALLSRHLLGKIVGHDKKKLLDQFGQQMVSKNGITIQILADITGKSGIKVSPIKTDIDLLVNTRKGFFKNMRSLKFDLKFLKSAGYDAWFGKGEQGEGVI